MLRGMEELRVSASEFRIYMKDLANHVAMGNAAVIVSRHGLPVGVWVNLQEYQAFREFQRKRAEQERAARGGVEVPDEHPDALPVDEVERLYRATAKATDDRTLRWRGKAWISLIARGRGSAVDPPS